MFNIGDYDYDDEDDNIRAPIEGTIDRLINDNRYGDDFEEFKQQIISDKSIDNNLKQVMIQSKKDLLDKVNESSIFRIEKSIRIGIISSLVTKLKNNNNNKLIPEQCTYILNNIEMWINGTIQIIKLNSETLYVVYELIDDIKKVRKEIDDNKMKNIFEPINYEEYVNYINIINDNKMKILNKEKEDKEKEIEKLNKIKLRQENVEILIHNLNRLSIFEVKIKNLKDEIELPLNKYIQLETDSIELNEKLEQKIKIFINSIRITKDTKDIILNALKII